MGRPRSDIRPRIIEAARARFLRDGVDGAALRGIAEDAGTSIGMVYYYFPTKDELFLGVVEDVYRGILEEIESVVRREQTVEARIQALLSRIARMSDVENMVVRIVLREALASNERLGQIAARFSRGHLPLIVSLMQSGVTRGELTDRHPLPILLMSLAALAVAPQIARRRIAEHSAALDGALPRPDAIAVALADVLFRGIGAKRR